MKTQTMKKKWLLNNEDGSVLILSLIILVVLTLIGIAASRTASIEIQISGNEVIYKQNLYMAEAAAMEAAQNLENTNLSTNPPAWVHGLGTVDEAARNSLIRPSGSMPIQSNQPKPVAIFQWKLVYYQSMKVSYQAAVWTCPRPRYILMLSMADVKKIGA